ncbi:hypothetical protein HAPAU_14210 [Halalkalicoccus paucihalophilus]|uniref:Uncharacterized protein n=1 Tax=Halalkalicoccus paucihalophilus TaxID=1008153 RepID=A0A151AFG8_9EURY|nr:hypothetical protein [Halalkalicoccus paucihalophilus]KYH26324.1 hypothetical protein HAPAU_14210 [Halalkalicoccus paucihalophilus]
MNEGSDGSNDIDGSRRRLLRASGALAGVLSMMAGTAAGGPIARGGERLPFEGEPVGAPHPACEDPPPEPTASDPDERYRELLERALYMRESYRSTLDHDAVRAVLRNRNDGFDGHLVFFAASDFGEPLVFLPEGVSDRDAALQAILDRLHERKWRARNPELRDVRHRLFEEVRGIHQGLPALYRSDGNAGYDIDYPWNRTYNFVTIRQAVGLVDWVTNANEPWLDGLRRTY